VWTVSKCTVDAMVVVVELRPSWKPVAVVSSDAGRMLANVDVVEAEPTIALLDIPDVLGLANSQPTLLLAASSPSPGWKARSVELIYPGSRFSMQTARRKTVMGKTLTALAPGEPYLIDCRGSVEVELIDCDQWLTSCDEDALVAGANLALIGRELVQFGSSIPLGAGRFRLSRLLRARGGTEWAAGAHSAGEQFVLIEADKLQPVTVPIWTTGAEVTAASGAATSRIIISGDSLRGPSPICAIVTWQPDGALQLSWTRRSRSGWAWLNEVDAPLGEAREEYRVTVIGSHDRLEFSASSPALEVAAADLARIGAGVAQVEIRQIGDLAASYPTKLTISI
jgi:hypothetical protein